MCVSHDVTELMHISKMMIGLESELILLVGVYEFDQSDWVWVHIETAARSLAHWTDMHSALSKADC